MSKAFIACIIPAIYMVAVLILGLGKWTRSNKVDINDFYKVSAGAAFPLVFLGLAGGYHSSFAIPGSMGFVYTHGVGWIANGLWTIFVAAFVMIVLGPRINHIARKYDYMTPSDIIANYFDESRSVRIATTIVTIAFSVGYMYTNVIGPAILLSVISEGAISYNASCALITLVVMLYVGKAGIRGTMWTTVLQACWMFVAVWVAAWYCVTLAGGTSTMMSAMKEQFPAYLTIPGPKNYLNGWTYFSWAAIAVGIGGALKPVVWNFYYSAQSPREAARIGYTIPFYLSMIYMPVVFIGFATVLIEPNLTGIGADRTFPQLLFDYAPAWFGGLIVAGSMGAGMSTLDAETNASSACFMSDVFRRYIAPGKTEEYYMKAARVSVVVLCLITYAFTFFRFNIVAIIAAAVNAIVCCYAPCVLFILSKSKIIKSLKVTAAGYVSGLYISLALLAYLNFFAKTANPFSIHYALWVLGTNIAVVLVVSAFTRAPKKETIDKFTNDIAEVYSA